MIRLPTMTICRNCIECGTQVKFDVKADDYDLWKDGGVLLQDALWYISADNREILLSGICGKCWDELFPENDSDDN